MKKVKLLIVNATLSQAGSERWIYEICKSIDKEKFAPAILCDRKYRRVDKNINHYNYYYYKLKDLGIPLYPDADFHAEEIYWRRGVNKFQRIVNRISNKIFNKINVSADRKVINLLKSFDVICVIDFYHYANLKKELERWCGDKFFVVLHYHKIQFDYDIYSCFDKDKKYNFTYFCPKQLADLASSGIDIKNNDFFFNPLLLDLSDFPYFYNQITDEPVVISVFTRIARVKPINMFIEAFARLREQLPRDCVLNIYGEIRDKDYYAELQQMIADLNLDENSIRFMGHTSNIAETIKNDKINVYWGLSISTSVGYASIEIGAMGVPCFFWSLDAENDFNLILEQTDDSMLVHNKTEEFVASNLKYLNDDRLLTDLSIKQRSFLIGRHDINDRIKNFEDYTLSIARGRREQIEKR